ncbi:L-histidine N(alpha)-methyltransferase [Rubrobacter marinus]|uniref:L-histidine N(Alpha)-methyltransferase n=1 Tax=Rubrobacter marinus TaxID=2653852 RepID=A0A6G8Q387_9ACTN|nr:L-histidine N(alpha)-methyltransferase [Rubrobacter marinus]
MAEDVRSGLLSKPKDLSAWPKYFYDARGSELFEEITELPEYYQTRTEASILEAKSREIVERTRCRELVELGSGSASKTRVLLDAMAEEEADPFRYAPLDVSESALEGSAVRLLEEYPRLEIRGYVGDFEGPLERVFSGDGEGVGRLVIFLGGTIGNFTPEKRREFLGKLRAGLREGDHLLVGMDLVKDPAVLEAAYDDAKGITAAFNKNLLRVLNERLGASFDPDLFEHRSVFDREESRVEMWLHSEVAQKAHVEALGMEVAFEAGEGMRTEISTKFTLESARAMFGEGGFELAELYTDPDDLFGLALGRA